MRLDCWKHSFEGRWHGERDPTERMDGEGRARILQDTGNRRESPGCRIRRKSSAYGILSDRELCETSIDEVEVGVLLLELDGSFGGSD